MARSSSAARTRAFSSSRTSTRPLNSSSCGDHVANTNVFRHSSAACRVFSGTLSCEAMATSPMAKSECPYSDCSCASAALRGPSDDDCVAESNCTSCSSIADRTSRWAWRWRQGIGFEWRRGWHVDAWFAEEAAVEGVFFSNDDGNGGVESGTRMRAGCWFVCAAMDMLWMRCGGRGGGW